jgi:hypothetical protein
MPRLMDFNSLGEKTDHNEIGMDLTLMDPVISLVYHIIYGVTLAGVHTLISGRRATTTG